MFCFLTSLVFWSAFSSVITTAGVVISLYSSFMARFASIRARRKLILKELYNNIDFIGNLKTVQCSSDSDYACLIYDLSINLATVNLIDVSNWERFSGDFLLQDFKKYELIQSINNSFLLLKRIAEEGVKKQKDIHAATIEFNTIYKNIFSIYGSNKAKKCNLDNKNLIIHSFRKVCIFIKEYIISLKGYVDRRKRNYKY